MPSDDLIEKTKAKLREQQFTTLLAEKPNSGLYLFFSFDLVNSTQFKAAKPDAWPVVVTRFYELVTSELSTRLTSAILWKYVGDEVLFYKRVTDRKDLHKALPATYDALHATIELLHKLYPETRELLSIKAAVWVAVAEFIQPADIAGAKLTGRNIIVPIDRSPTTRNRDFLGPDIDAGFRISRFALRRRLVVSAHLAWLLYYERVECSGIEAQLRIVGFESLKGVWEGRHYPIIWYEKDWIRVADSFLYDEHINSEMVRRIKGWSDSDGKLGLIEKIFSDLGKEAEVQSFLGALQAAVPSTEDDLVEIEIPREKYSEVHCVAVCFSPNGKVLVAKRPGSKKRFPNAFEFGCGQLKLGDTFGDCLRRAYRDDFGITLKVDDCPVPIGTFLIDDKEEHRSIPGIIFVAEVDDPENVAKSFSREKHSEIDWLDPQSFQPLPGRDYVPNLAETLAAAVKSRERH